ncbi:MAG: pyridoxamine 5'-phosphate oxidase [Myxococcales bacterium]|nr:pyridoxamine 5'-phosphate oxidase [Myxococcales bacterium]
MSKPVQDLRRDYRAGSLEADELPTDPLDLFQAWFEDARDSEQVLEPNAMAVATVSEEGAPSVRFVLLKSYDARGFVFYTNYTSRKGREVDATGRAALVFWWGALERQVRVEGKASRIAAEESDAYFEARPRGSRVGAWASPQSEEIASRDALKASFEAREEEFADKPIPRPPHWGGYRVELEVIEFWQGRSNRLHDRFVYRRAEDGAWEAPRRLAP